MKWYLARVFRIAAIYGFVATFLVACTSHQHKPEPDTLIAAPDCALANGTFGVESAAESTLLDDYLFRSGELLSAVRVALSDGAVDIEGITVADASVLNKVHRFACNDSVLTLIIKDEGGGDGLVMQAADTKLELFATDTESLAFRFIDTQLTFLFLLPVYDSTDRLLVLRRLPD